MTTYYPTLEQVRSMAQPGQPLPRVSAPSTPTWKLPVSAYLKVARPPYSFLLESVAGGERIGRYSFIGTEPYDVFSTGADQPSGTDRPVGPWSSGKWTRSNSFPLTGLPPFHGGGVGYVAYDAVHYFEPRVPMPDSDPQGLPESVFMFTDTLLVFDHLRHDIKVVSHARLDGGDPNSDQIKVAYEAADRQDRAHGGPSLPSAGDPARTAGDAQPAMPSGWARPQSNFTVPEYEAIVDKCIEYIYAGDVIQVVNSQRFSRHTDAHPFQVYRALRGSNPSPYMYYLDLNGFQIVGAAIETVATVHDGTVATHPIAGTRPRGQTPAEDVALEEELRGSEKQQAEHIMLLDLGRNDIGRVSMPGTVEVTQYMDVERFSHVMHLVSHVEGRLRPDMTPYDALRACFPAGTVSGAPKIRAMEIIAEVERERRGPYGGAVAYFSYNGNMDTALVLRTGIFKDGVMYVQAGGGVVADSIAEDEYMETRHKSGAMMRAIDVAEGAV